ncbi:imidazole glycerol phosphate synthase subunit hisF [Thermoplasmatales archaeon BRNA1]|nr:imidazole glycerol phosphate synthase subunit hisF [Thermoplasmatales archaeon BRNA1]
MSLTKRVIPCLDVKNGKVVKGTEFVNLRDVGYPPDLAKRYSDQGADEITFLDIAASKESRGTTLDLVRETAEKVFVPLTVGGGIRTAEDVHQALLAGADKVSINSAAVAHPEVISESSERFGRQCVVVAIDAKRVGDDKWEVYVKGGSEPTGIDALEWAGEAEDRGAGEILLTSIDADGTKNGYDIPLTRAVVEQTNIPVIASGGCGKMEDIYEVFAQTDCSAALAASIFHYNECTPDQVHEYLRDKGIETR